MAKKEWGLAVVGNALVDILADADEAFVAAQARQCGMQRGAMNLINPERARELYGLMGQGTVMSGGSGANSLSAFASFGGRGAFMGKVADDELGGIFRHDMQSQGIGFDTPVYAGALETGRSYILVTPDGERTMNTYLGASTEIMEADIDEAAIAGARILLLEGYLFDRPEARRAFEKAAAIAAAAGTQVAFTLSDHRCVERHHADFVSFVRNHTALLIGNEKEMRSLTLQADFESAAAAARDLCGMLVLTRGARGAVIVCGAATHEIAAARPEKIVDTTGAGDAFAGGLLYGLTQGMPPGDAGALGAKAAALTIAHIGARSPHVSFATLLP